MRHRRRGRKLGRNPSHRKAMFRNMACSLIRSVRIYEDDSGHPEPGSPKVEGRIVTTLPKAKELRPMVEKLVTLARKARVIEDNAQQYASTADRNSDEYKAWRKSERWNEWNQAVAPAVAARRRAFATLRDHEAVDILFDELAERFSDRPGGYTRVVRLAEVRLGDAGQKALIEFVGQNDRVQSTRRRGPAPVVTDEPVANETTAEDSSTEEESPETDETAVATEEGTAEETATEPTAEDTTETGDAPEGDSEEKKAE